MSITEKIGEEKKEIESLLDEAPRKKLSKEEKEKIIKEEVAKSQYYENLGMI